MKFKTVDRIAEIQAQIDVLAAQAEKLRAQLKARGEGEYYGSEFVATVVEFEKRSLDLERVKKILTPAQLRRVTLKTDVTMLRLRPIES